MSFGNDRQFGNLDEDKPKPKKTETLEPAAPAGQSQSSGAFAQLEQALARFGGGGGCESPWYGPTREHEFVAGQYQQQYTPRGVTIRVKLDCARCGLQMEVNLPEAAQMRAQVIHPTNSERVFQGIGSYGRSMTPPPEHQSFSVEEALSLTLGAEPLRPGEMIGYVESPHVYPGQPAMIRITRQSRRGMPPTIVHLTAEVELFRGQAVELRQNGNVRPVPTNRIQAEARAENVSPQRAAPPVNITVDEPVSRIYGELDELSRMARERQEREEAQLAAETAEAMRYAMERDVARFRPPRNESNDLAFATFLQEEEKRQQRKAARAKQAPKRGFFKGIGRGKR